MQGYCAEAVHSLKGEPNVIDVRNIGLIGGIELAPMAGAPGKRAFDIFLDCFDKGALIRTTGDTVALSPPLIIERSHIDQLVDTLRGAIRRQAGAGSAAVATPAPAQSSAQSSDKSPALA